MKKIIFITISALIVTGCYRMPEDGEVSVVPVTNNPSMTRQQNSCLPGIEY